MVNLRSLGVFAAAVCVLTQPATAATVFEAALLGVNENPPAATPATGTATITINGTQLIVSAQFQNLTTGLADGHIHCCVGPAGNAGVAIGFTGLPLGSTTGIIGGTYDLTLASTFRAAFITGSGGTVELARERFLNELNGGQTYFNLHSQQFPGGEIRGQLRAAVPEPSSWALMILGFGATGAALRRHGRTTTRVSCAA